MHHVNHRYFSINAVLAALVLLAAVTLAGMLASRAFGGPLDPPGPVGSTRPIVEPRIPITQPASAAGFPIVLSEPGSYYFASNITGVAGKGGISVTASNVDIDLNGFHLAGVPGSGTGLNVTGTSTGSFSLRNGVVRNWGSDGVASFSTTGVYEDLNIISNGSTGLGMNANNIVRRVVVRNHSGYGIRFFSLGSNGSVTDSISSNNGYGIGLGGSNITVRNSIVTGNTVVGFDVDGTNNIVDGNFIRQNGMGVRMGGSGNSVVRNLIIQTAATDYDNFGANNHIGPDATIGAGTVSSADSYSNIRFDP
jgi:hypothetical protein